MAIQADLFDYRYLRHIVTSLIILPPSLPLSLHPESPTGLALGIGLSSIGASQIDSGFLAPNAKVSPV